MKEIHQRLVFISYICTSLAEEDLEAASLK